MLGLIVCAAIPALAGGREDSPKITGLRLGVANRYKTGLWTEAEVLVSGGFANQDCELSLIVPDGDGTPSRVSARCKISSGGETTVRAPCRLGRVNCAIEVELLAKGQIIARRRFESGPKVDEGHFLPGIESRGLIVVVGGAAVNVEDAAKVAGTPAEYRSVVARLKSVRDLPQTALGYNGIDAVMLFTSQSEVFRDISADDPRIRAIDEWIRNGGRMIVCAGEHSERLFASDSAWRRFLPGRFDRMVVSPPTGGLESYCGSRDSIPQPADRRAALRVPRLTEVRGIVEAGEVNLPLVVRTVRGFGQVIFVAADLDRPPLSAWSDCPLLIAKLLDLPTGMTDDADEGAAMMHLGYNDLAGQLRSALDCFDGVSIAPFWLVAALIVCYLLLIGPGDYFFLRKIVGRMTFTWLTFPSIVLLVCLGAYLLAERLKGDRLRVAQADLVDVDVATGRIRGAAWLNIFSPRVESLNLSIQPVGLSSKDADTHAWLGWFGLPGGAIGGMNPRAGEVSQWSEPYAFSFALDAMRGVPITTWATKSFTARWSAAAQKTPEAELIDENQLLAGSMTNTLEFPLTDCLLAYGRSVYELGTIAPGESVRFDSMSKRSELKTMLTGRKIVADQSGDKYHQQATPYDQSSADIPYILREMNFYDASGGRRYTGLLNAYQSFVDLSSLLLADRAILVTQILNNDGKKIEGATVLFDGRELDNARDKHITVYRFIFPVKRK